MKLTKVDVVKIFREENLPAVRAHFEQDGIPDYPARCEEWGFLTDSLCKAGCITLAQYERWSAPPECSRRKERATC
jgi:hypothetical protein